MYLKQIQDNNLKDFLEYSKNLTKLYQVNRFDYDEDIRFYAFYFDLILSKFKHSLFLYLKENF